MSFFRAVIVILNKNPVRGYWKKSGLLSSATTWDRDQISAGRRNYGITRPKHKQVFFTNSKKSFLVIFMSIIW